MEKQIKVGDLGITLVAETPVAGISYLVKAWLNVPDWAIAISEPTQSPGTLRFYVSNEYIDWAHFRQHSAYRPVKPENN